MRYAGYKGTQCLQHEVPDIGYPCQLHADNLLSTTHEFFDGWPCTVPSSRPIAMGLYAVYAMLGRARVGLSLSLWPRQPNRACAHACVTKSGHGPKRENYHTMHLLYYIRVFKVEVTAKRMACSKLLHSLQASHFHQLQGIILLMPKRYTHLLRA